MSSSSYKGVKLEPSNYYEWQNSALAYISARGVYEYIEHPDGLRPRVGSSPSADVISAAKDAAERAGGVETAITAPAPPPAGQPAGAPAVTTMTTTKTWFVSLPNPVTRRIESVTLAPKSVSQADYRDWVKQARIAVGVIWDTLGPTIQRNENVAYLMRSGDPLLLWAAIFRRVNPTTASARFSAMSSLMSVTWQDGWALEDGHAAVTEKFNNYLDHRAPGMTADDVLDEVALFAYLSIVPPELDTFSSTVFINAGDRALTLPELLRVLQQEDSTQELRGNPRQTALLTRVASELAARAQAATRPVGPSGAAQSGPIKLTPREALAALQASRPTWTKCWLCFGDHTLDACTLISRAQRYAKELRETKNDNRRPQQSANAAIEAVLATAGNDEHFPEAPNVRHFVSAAFALRASRTRDRDADWIMDTGCTSHMTPHRRWFKSYAPHRVGIELADKSVIYSLGVGTVEFIPVVKGVSQPAVTFHHVLHVPSLGANLFAVLRLTKSDGYECLLQGDRALFSRGKRLEFTGSINDDLVGKLDGSTVHSTEAARRARPAPTADTWHRRLGHVAPAVVSSMYKSGAAKGMRLAGATAVPLCPPCIAGKQKRDPIARSRQKRTEVLDVVHWDLKTTLPRSREGFLHWAIGVDDAGRMKAIYFLRRKSDFYDHFVEFVAWAERRTGRKLLVKHDDKGGEFVSKKLLDYCRRNGIEIRQTETGEPWQNGVAERANGDIADHVTALLTAANLPRSWWPFAAACYVYVSNRTIKSALPTGVTPYEYWYGKKPDIRDLRVFGCLAYALEKPEVRKSFESHTRPSLFIGYSTEKDGCWRFYDLRTHKVFECSTAHFVESVFPGHTADWRGLLTDIEQYVHGPADTHSAYVRDEQADDLQPIPGEDLVRDSVDHDDPAPEPMQPPQPDAPIYRPVLVMPRNRAPPAPRNVEQPEEQPHDDGAMHEDAPRALDAPAPPADPNVHGGGRPRRERPAPGSMKEQDGRRSMRSYPTSTVRAQPVSEPGPEPAPAPPPQQQDVQPQDNGQQAAQSAQLVSNGDDEELDLLVPEDPAERAMLVTLLDSVLDSAYHTQDEALEYCYNAMTQKEREPRTWKEVLALPTTERQRWTDAANAELQNLLHSGTFQMVPLPEGRRAIGSQWVFKLKRKADGSVERYKARLVARGDAQRPGVDYGQTFAPTVRWGTLRTIFALVALKGYACVSADISAAYLNGDLHEEVYMRQPEGFHQGAPNVVWRLIKALYGLKQAGRMWHLKLNEILTEMGYTRSLVEHCVWVYARGDVHIIVPVYVDDLTAAAPTEEQARQVITELKKHFDLRELGETSWLLGVEVLRDRSRSALALSQRQYALDVLRQYGMEDCTPVKTAMDRDAHLSVDMCPKTDEARLAMRDIPYINAVGSLAYLAIATRPDIQYAVGVLARFQSNPGPEHWNAVKHLMRYVKGTLNYKLVYAPDRSVPEDASAVVFRTYSDADLGGDASTGRSTSGMVVKIGTGATNWTSKLQPTVSLSTTEAEYIAACAAGQEIVFNVSLLRSLGFTVSTPPTLHIDNRSAVQVAQNPEHHGRMKHLDVKYFWLRQQVDAGHIRVEHIRTDKMPADVLTKALAANKMADARRLLGLYESFSELP